jgi:haloacetate dehalogenase
MSPAHDLFAGFAVRRIAVPGVEIFARIGGAGPPLLLLHGYPQTHHCWHAVAGRLAEHRTVVAADLRGYGASSVPEVDPAHHAYSKRQMAADMVALMRALGHDRFAVAGHDRGGRVAYRMALDHPGAVTRLLALDIVMTAQVWRGMDQAVAIKSYHWPFLAQPHPLPETLINANPAFYADWTLASWTRPRNLSCFAPAALERYRALLADPARVRAVCEDYRAGATVDRELDEGDLAAGRRIACPMLALWGSDYVGRGAASPLALWREIADDVSGEAIEAGHFLAEEAPEATVSAMLAFLAKEAP